MRGDVRHDVDLPDHAVGVDQIGDPPRVFGMGIIGRAGGPVAGADLAFDIGDQREVEVLVLCESAVVLDGVEGGADDADTEPLEVGGSITEPLSLDRSTPGRGLREPPEGDPMAALVGEPEASAPRVGEVEVGSEVAFLERYLDAHRVLMLTAA